MAQEEREPTMLLLSDVDCTLTTIHISKAMLSWDKAKGLNKYKGDLELVAKSDKHPHLKNLINNLPENLQAKFKDAFNAKEKFGAFINSLESHEQKQLCLVLMGGIERLNSIVDGFQQAKQNNISIQLVSKSTLNILQFLLNNLPELKCLLDKVTSEAEVIVWDLKNDTYDDSDYQDREQLIVNSAKVTYLDDDPTIINRIGTDDDIKFIHAGNAYEGNGLTQEQIKSLKNLLLPRSQPLTHSFNQNRERRSLPSTPIDAIKAPGAASTLIDSSSKTKTRPRST